LLAVDRLYKSRNEWTVEIIRKGQGKKNFRKDKTAEELAALVQAVAMGAQFTVRVTREATLVRNLKDQVIEMLKTK
jgi:hypothetical protein